ncbi:hypothetical protein PN498_05450 [Oscillatoria sp. CS-180]|uniref:hypothetical protein n=1 Tax=Oscillatoria sp. CS-180 TaxID=3021720 RepID=UPI00232E8384|nr:hypothetical protein [Oscillatoria sp. CS-180]MDB9525423.1 hypothetical protein [Oscillatoria sp. CS-180]
MFWMALMLLGLAIAAWRYGSHQTDEVVQFLSLSLALVCLMGGIVAAPGLLKVVFLAGLVTYPTCAPGDRIIKPTCPRFCPWQSQCKSPRRSIDSLY